MKAAVRTRKTFKRIVTILVCVCLVFGFSTYVFAAIPTDYGNSSFQSPISSDPQNLMWMNTWTTGSAAQGNYIRLYSYTGDNTQRWVARSASGGKYSMRCVDNTALAINRADPSAKAILWNYNTAGTPDDSDMAIPIDGSTWQFHLARTGESLHATGGNQGDYVVFSSSGWNIDWRRVG